MISKFSYGDFILLRDLEEDLEIYNGLLGEVQYHLGDGEYEVLVLETINITVSEANLEPSHTR